MSYVAYGIIGVKVPDEKLFKKYPVRNCNCDSAYKEGKDPIYCSECGKKFFHIEERYIKQIKEDNGEHPYLFLDKYPLIRTVNYQKISGSNLDYIDLPQNSFIVLKMAKGSGSRSETTPNTCAQLPTKEMIEKFKNDLGTHELWDEKQFRMWSVIVSC